MRYHASTATALARAGLEARFDATFTAELAIREKQIQQNYRPIIGIHKWFARRPGTVFRALLLSEYADTGSLSENFWHGHEFSGVIADPFMGGGTTVYEANRLGFHVVGCDINPMAHWIVRQSLMPLSLVSFRAEAKRVVEDVEKEIGALYRTRCLDCGDEASVKYFLWVKTAPCPHCHERNDLFPGYRLAEAERHPRHVLTCAECGALNEFDVPPTRSEPQPCNACGAGVHVEGNVHRKKLTCRKCREVYSVASFSSPPQHRMWAVEYHCAHCYPNRPGRQFKAPDKDDLDRAHKAEKHLKNLEGALPIPSGEIPRGDETDRLHRWGYRRYWEMFNERQRLGLGLLLQRIARVPEAEVRHALLTVFSDTLRYQNMLCRYDTYALKCQDIFSVHGFPVALVQCENNLLGISGVGSGSFRHFVEKYARAKDYCAAPFETRNTALKKVLVPVIGETIRAELVQHLPNSNKYKQAFLVSAPSQRAPLTPNSLDGVFTDPPYFDNVQYAELIDFCFAWLREVLQHEFPEFRPISTRSSQELTGNETLGRDIEHFTQGISEVFCHFARALKPGAPFVFTYHHNDPNAYLPIVVAILDAGLECTATLPAAAEMTASLHIAGTGSSVLDSVFVCRPIRSRPRRRPAQLELPLEAASECARALESDAHAMKAAGIKVTAGDLRCLVAGHIARIAIRALRLSWDASSPLSNRMVSARQGLLELTTAVDVPTLIQAVGIGISGLHNRTTDNHDHTTL